MVQRIAYVTGGMGGIGTSICQRLAKEGHTVIAGCGPSRDYNKWLNEQKEAGFTFHASVGNVADWDSTKEALAWLGRRGSAGYAGPHRRARQRRPVSMRIRSSRIRET